MKKCQDIRHYGLRLILTVLLLSPLLLHAQDNSTLRQVFDQAQEDYRIGRIDQAMQQLLAHVNDFQGNLKQNAYRLISLCYLAQDDMEQSENYAALLLQENQYYTSVNDPIRFEELITRLKTGRIATITTASSQAESLDEAPVPVTLITEEMIAMSGARNLKELLIAYVPGMTTIESNEEMNFALHGVYSAGQEKILILLNGHRLNSYSTNVACPDFSMSLDKVAQIEVLRGPASSLYGGVALTGVVNIITKQGIDVGGLQAKGSIGNYGQLQGNILFGNRYMDFDVFVWANIYNATGQTFYYDKASQPYAIYPIEGDVTIGGYNKKPSYDYGATVSWKGVSILFNSHFSKMQSPYSMSVMFAPYSYDDYNSFNGSAPGYAVGSQHGELSFSQSWKRLGFKVAATIDHETQQRYQIIGDTVPDMGYNAIPIAGLNDTLMAYNGFFQNHFWQSTAVGANIQGSYQYKSGRHEGLVLLGAHVNRFSLVDSEYSEGDEFGRVLRTFDESKNLILGWEVNTDGYLQVKHKWGKSFILNVGLRYDLKHRNDSRNISVLSPRVAAIYVIKSWNVKASYARSFVDAPYYYRNTTLDIKGSGVLNPEFMDSWQLSCTNSMLVKGLTMDANVYYNHARDFVYNDQLNGLYINAGYLKSIGAELLLNYSNKRLHAIGNLSWQHVVASDMYPVDGHSIYNIPQLQSSLTFGYKITNDLSAHLNTIVTAQQTCQSIVQGADQRDDEIPARAIFNAGAKYQLRPFTFELNVYNLFNKKYYQGGNSNAPIRQQGLWLLFNASVKI